jgi:hypothetical protein
LQIGGLAPGTYALDLQFEPDEYPVRLSQSQPVAVTVNALFDSVSLPTITGDATVGKTLTAEGVWYPTPDTIRYQWHRNGVPINGATTKSYRLVEADGGSSITVEATGEKSGYASSSRTSATKAVVAMRLTATPTPTISGTGAVGKTLIAVGGAWGPSPVTLEYRWYRNGVLIAEATASTYKLTVADAGKAITVRVTGNKTGYTTVAKTSAAKAVAKQLTATPTPTISGTGVVGKTLTAVAGTWGPSPVTLKYRWYRNGAAISDATAGTYKLTVADAGKAITVRVTGNKTGYTTIAQTSAAKTVQSG